MKRLLEHLIPIRLALSVGGMRVFAISMFDLEDEDEDRPLVSASGGFYGFGRDPVDEMAPRLEPLEDENDPDTRSWR